MKRLLLLASLLALPGCAHITTQKTITGVDPATRVVVTTNISMHATTFLSNTALKNLSLDSATKTTSSVLKLSGAATEPNPDAITASGTALGELIGAAAKSAVKP